MNYLEVGSIFGSHDTVRQARTTCFVKINSFRKLDNFVFNFCLRLSLDAQTPQIFNEENQYRVDLGADILIQCNVSGFPYPSVSWLQGQTLVGR